MRDATDQRSEGGRRLRPLVVIVACIVVARVLLLRSPDLVANPDECLIGMMAIDRLKGGSPAIFMWGQHYGLSFFEVEVAAIGFSIFGIGITVLKASMLVPFALGAIFLCAWIRRAHGERASWIAGGLVAFSPAMLPFSLQAHGGYLTAFAALHFAIYLLWTRPVTPISKFARNLGFVVGASTVALGQPLFLPFLVAYSWLHPGAERSIVKRAAPWFAAMVLTAIVRHLGSQGPLAHHLDPFANSHPLDQLLLLPGRLLVACSGRYLLNQSLTTTIASTIAGSAFLALLAVAAAHAGITLRHARSRRDATGLAALLTVIVIVAVTSGVNEVAYGPRYLLPAIDAAILLAARTFDRSLEAAHPHWIRLARGLSLVAIATGAAAMVDVGLDPRQDTPVFEQNGADLRSLRSVLADLETAGVQHAFVINGMLQWTVMFESKGEITARSWWQIHRRMDFPPLVDRALRQGKPTAIIGRDVLPLVREFVRSRGIEDRLVVHDERWYYILDPDEELVRAMNFRLSSP